MKYYAIYLKNSTGYIEGTIPPEFSDSHIKPIDALGSDSIFYLDGRWSLATMKYEIEKRMNEMNKNLGSRFIGYKIYYNPSERVIYNSLREDKLWRM